MEVPLSRPDITDAEIAAVTGVLKTPHLSLGPRLPGFEEACARYTGAKHAVAVNSGTSALHLCVRALEIGDGDEVITSPFSFVASANCMLYERAVPVFADIDRDTYNMDIDAIRDKITPRTKAVLAVHIFGRPMDMDPLRELAAEHGLTVFEDSCEALGAEYRGKKAGTFGRAGTFAFYPNKQMTTGEGGMIITDDEEVAAVCRSMRNQGRGGDGKWLTHERLGYNYRLSDINCALGEAQLSRIEDMLDRREAAAGRYCTLLAGADGIVLPDRELDGRISWFVFVIRLARGGPDERDRVLARLREKGVGCNDYFRPIHLQPFYRKRYGYGTGAFPVTEEVAGQTIALPFYNSITEEEQSYVCTVLQKAVGEVLA